MTLKDKFVGADRYSIRKTTLADRCEQIAEEFAIGFAKYVLINNGKYKYIDLEKMLKLFKKEKGL